MADIAKPTNIIKDLLPPVLNKDANAIHFGEMASASFFALPSRNEQEGVGDNMNAKLERTAETLLEVHIQIIAANRKCHTFSRQLILLTATVLSFFLFSALYTCINADAYSELLMERTWVSTCVCLILTI